MREFKSLTNVSLEVVEPLAGLGMTMTFREVMFPSTSVVSGVIMAPSPLLSNLHVAFLLFRRHRRRHRRVHPSVWRRRCRQPSVRRRAATAPPPAKSVATGPANGTVITELLTEFFLILEVSDFREACSQIRMQRVSESRLNSLASSRSLSPLNEGCFLSSHDWYLGRRWPAGACRQ